MTVIQFYSNIDEKRLARAHKKFQHGQHSEIYLLTLKKQDKTKMELPHDIVIISASSCRTNPINRIDCKVVSVLRGNMSGNQPNIFPKYFTDSYRYRND